MHHDPWFLPFVADPVSSRSAHRSRCRTIADQDAAGLIFEDVLRDFLHTRLSGDADADDPVAALFLGDENRPEDLIADLAQNLRRYRGARIDVYPHERDSCASLRQAVAEFRGFLNGAPCQEPETEDIVAGLEAQLGALPSDDMARVPTLLALMRLSVPEVCRTAKGFAAYRKLGKWRTAAKARGSQAEADRLHTRAGDLYAACRDVHALVQGAAAGCLLSLIGGEVTQVVAAFQEAKRAAALLDFDDLLHDTRNLLTRSDEVRAALAARYRHVLVDEFQDTDPLQGRERSQGGCAGEETAPQATLPCHGRPGRYATACSSWSEIPNRRSTASAAPMCKHHLRGSRSASKPHIRSMFSASAATPAPSRRSLTV